MSNTNSNFEKTIKSEPKDATLGKRWKKTQPRGGKLGRREGSRYAD